ncbi:MAG TPA: sorbosone dehydrogenase family protein [Pyrinomonadaceae bacterium]|nr:sorbosone dehydrogenase family protein [Pyrinomonadaceae bacterium]
MTTKTRSAFLRLSALLALALLNGSVSAQSTNSGATTGTPLAHYDIRPADLPPPKIENDVNNPPRVIARPEGAQLNLPPGFEVSVFAEGGFTRPRWLALAPNGDVFVADSMGSKVFVLRDANKDGVAEERSVFAEGLKQPFGIAFWHDYVYIGNTDAVIRYAYKPGQLKAEGAPEKLADLPGLGYREHWTRNILFSPDGKKMYVTVGSETNVSVEENSMRATITEFNPDGTGKRTYASGTRNPIGLAWLPGTKTMWAAVQERDLLGDNLVPDYVTEIKDGGFYGWPFGYLGVEDPRRKGERPDLVQKIITPNVLIQAHSAVLGMVFYQGRMFPSEYRGDAFVALHGSWNRRERTGYKIIRIRFKNGKPVGGYDDFLTGWMLDPNRREVWGRPVGLLVLPDGSMLIADDGANKIWRVSYRGK